MGVPIGISIPQELLEKIDKDRGDVNRSRFIQRLIEYSYSEKERREKKK